MNREIKFQFIVDNKFLSDAYTLEEIMGKDSENIFLFDLCYN